jgi:RecA/RadA recombinase
MDDNKKKALAAALGQIERQFGKGAVMRMGGSRPSGDPGYLDWLSGSGHRARHWRPAKRPYR